MIDEKYVKVTFYLNHDEDGYPPVNYESVWLKKNEQGEYELDNIPFYIYGVSKCDVLAFQENKGEFVVSGVLRNNGHSTMRVYMNVEEQKINVISALQLLGGVTNSANASPLFGLDIPPSVSISDIDLFLKDKLDEGILDYEDACLQHTGIDEKRLKECKALTNIKYVNH